MLECIILGDSIAVGTQMFYKECQLMGKGGINSWQFNQMYPVLIETSKLAIISLGTNDHIGVNTKSITLTPNIDWSEVKISKNAKR